MGRILTFFPEGYVIRSTMSIEVWLWVWKTACNLSKFTLHIYLFFLQHLTRPIAPLSPLRLFSTYVLHWGAVGHIVLAIIACLQLMGGTQHCPPATYPSLYAQTQVGQVFHSKYLLLPRRNTFLQRLLILPPHVFLADPSHAPGRVCCLDSEISRTRLSQSEK